MLSTSVARLSSGRGGLMGHLVSRLHAPAVALRLTREELLLSMASLTSLLQLCDSSSSRSGPHMAPGVLAQRCSQLVWSAGNTREVSVIVGGSHALGWDPNVCPQLWDGVLARMAKPSTSSSPPAASSLNADLALITRVCRALRDFIGTSRGSVRHETGDDETVAEREAVSGWASLTLDRIVDDAFATNVVDSRTSVSLDELDGLLHYAVHVRLTPPTLAFLTRVARVTESLVSSGSGASQPPTTDAVPQRSLLLSVLQHWSTLQRHLKREDDAAVAQCAVTHLMRSTEFATAEETVCMDPLWITVTDEGAALEGRLGLLRQVIRLPRAMSEIVEAPRELPHVARMFLRTDTRDVEAANVLIQTVMSWLRSQEKATPDTQHVISEMVFLSRKSAALAHLESTVSAAARAGNFAAPVNDAIMQVLSNGDAVAQLAHIQVLLQNWEGGIAPAAGELFALLNQSHQWSPEQLVAAVLLFPQQLQECYQQVLVPLRLWLRDIMGGMTSMLSTPLGVDGSHSDAGQGVLPTASKLLVALWSVGSQMTGMGGIIEEMELLCMELLEKAVDIADLDALTRSSAYLPLAIRMAASRYPWGTEGGIACLRRMDQLVRTVSLRLLSFSSSATVWSSCGSELLRALGTYQASTRRHRLILAAQKGCIAHAHEASVKEMEDTLAQMHHMSLTQMEQQAEQPIVSRAEDVISIAIRALEVTVAFDANTPHVSQLMSVVRRLLETDEMFMQWMSPSTHPAAANAFATFAALQLQWRAPELEGIMEKWLRRIHDNPDTEWLHVQGSSPHGAHRASLILGCALTYQFYELANRATKALASVDFSLLHSQASATADLLALPCAAIVSLGKAVRSGTPLPGSCDDSHVGGNGNHVVAGALSAALSCITELLVNQKIIGDVSQRARCTAAFASGVEHLRRLDIPLSAATIDTLLMGCTTVQSVALPAEAASILVNVAYAVARLDLHQQASVSKVGPWLEATCERLPHWCGTWSPNTLCEVLSALGEVPQMGKSMSHHAALSVVTEHAVDHAEQFFSGRHIARMLLGLAKSMVTSRSLYQVFAGRLKRRPILLSLQRFDVSCVLQAFGTAKLADKELLDGLGKRAMQDADSLQPDDIVAVAKSFSRMSLIHRPLYAKVGARAAEIVQQLSATQASQLISAFGNVGVSDDRLAAAVVAQIPASSYTASEAADAITGLWQMNFSDDEEALEPFADRISELDGEGLTRKQLMALCSVTVDLKWRHPKLLRALGTRAAQLQKLSEGESGGVPSESGEARETARIVLSTLNAFRVHHSDARLALTASAKQISRDVPTLSEMETNEIRQLMER